MISGGFPGVDPEQHPWPQNIQIRRAMALAMAHSHGWASDVYEHLRDGGAPPESWSECEDIFAAAREAEPDDLPGVCSGLPVPKRDHTGDVVHETMTGRLRWVVNDLGQVQLTVSRPWPTSGGSRIVLWASVDPDGRVSLETSGTLYARHARAAWDALDAVFTADWQHEQQQEDDDS